MLNPFFGGSIVPFNCHLNWSEAPNVVFDAEGDDVVGRAERPIAAGDELTQGYADSTAELVYRYGFSPAVDDGTPPPTTEEDVVSIRVHAIAAACGDAAVRRVRQYGPLLSAAGLADAQTWDGVGDDLTVELSAGATGTAQLVGTAHAPLAECRRRRASRKAERAPLSRAWLRRRAATTGRGPRSPRRALRPSTLPRRRRHAP